MTDHIHPTAIVEEGALLGEGVRVWHHVHIMAGARIGAGTSLGKDVFVAGGAVLGAGCKVQNGVSLYDGVTLEDEVFIGPHAVFTNVVFPRAFRSGRHALQPTSIGRGATLGAGATVVCGHSIGPYAFVGAGAVVTSNVPAYALVVGNPARRIGWVSRVGARLSPVGTSAVCPMTGERYRIEGEVCSPLTPKDDREPQEDPVEMQGLSRESAHFAVPLRAAFERVLASGSFVLGREVAAFEEAFANQVGVAHAVGVSSGSDALFMALSALGVGPGDEVITTSLSFVATLEAILRVGATPVFVDVCPRRLTLDPKGVERAITPKTKAILPVHLFGCPVHREVFDVARDRSIPVIEDAAQAIGATESGASVGALGAMGCFSFFPTKNLGAVGDGGMITTDSSELASVLRSLRAHGSTGKHHYARLGGNFRLDSLQAAFLSAKLPSLGTLNERRRSNAALYDEAFAGLPMRLPDRHLGQVFHHYVVQTEARDALMAHLGARGVRSEVYYPYALHKTPLFEASVSLPNAERASAEALVLPVHPWLRSDETSRVIGGVRSFFVSG